MVTSPDQFDPLAIVVDWLDTCRFGDLGALVDTYDERATLECGCDGVTLIGRASIAAYWGPKLAMASSTAFAMDNLTLTADGVCLDYRNYEGDPVRMLFRFTSPARYCTLSVGCSVSVAPPDRLTAHRLLARA